MRLMKRMAFVIAGLGLFVALPGQYAELHGQQRGAGEGRGAAGGGRGQAPAQMEVWVPMPVKSNPFIAEQGSDQDFRSACQA